jgi:hypothetical protein
VHCRQAAALSLSLAKLGLMRPCGLFVVACYMSVVLGLCFLFLFSVRLRDLSGLR